MAVSMNSVISFHAPASYQLVERTNTRTLLKLPSLVCPIHAARLSGKKSRKKLNFFLPVSHGDQVATETSEQLLSDEGSLDEPVIVNSFSTEDKNNSFDESVLTAQVSEDSLNSTNPNQETPVAESKGTIKRSPLTARERLRAARVLSRYTEPKPSKPELGIKLLEALRESDKGKKRPGLPEAPKNLFDDSKRGLPKQGWSINIIPGGMDVFLIIFSFVFISTVMFATTFIVWKVGAIHFNEY